MIDSLTVAILISYLLGSIPFGLIIAKILKVDIRTKGSKNIGSTNVTRIIGKKAGALTLFLDFLKGYMSVWLSLVILFDDFDLFKGTLCAFSAILGHIFPIWLKFKGGKGVATYLGVLFAIFPKLGLVALASWFVIFYFKKISSLSALSMVVIVQIILFYLQDFNNVSGVFFIITTLIIYRHKSNFAEIKKSFLKK